MDAPNIHLQPFVEKALHNNDTEQSLMNVILKEIDKTSLLSFLNEYFASDNCRQAKCFLGKAMLHFKLNDNAYNCEEIEKLARNVTRLLCGSHKSVVSLLDVQRKILRTAGISETTRLTCLYETLVRVSKTPYPLNKQLMELCKHTMRFISQELRMQQFSLCMEWVEKSLYADVHYMVLSELLNYVPLPELIDATPRLLEYICAGFCMNITAVQRGHIYKALVDRFILFDWENYVFMSFIDLLDKYETNECFMESLKCYFVPPTAIKYREHFYVASRRFIKNRTFCAFVLVYLVRRGFCNAGHYLNDIMIFSRQEDTASMGFELLCKTNQLSEIVDFLYEYRWTEDKEKIISCLDRMDLSGVFHFGVVLMCSGSRTHTEFGVGLLKTICRERVCEKKYWKLLFSMYMKNSAVPASFIYDLVRFGDYEDLRVGIEKYKGSKNIGCLTKASYIQHIYAKKEADLSFLLGLTDKLSNIDVETFADGSTLLYIKTFKLSCQDEIMKYNSDSVFGTFHKCVTTLLTSNIASKLRSTDERKIYEALLSDVLTAMQFILQKNANENLANQLIESCYATIQLSNFKEPVTTASTILQKAATFATSETLTNLIDTCFKSINLRDADVSTIRRSAEYRLVLEKMCIADSSRKEDILCRLLELLKDDSTTEVAIEAALHTIDALFSNKSLQIWTRSYIEDVVELLFEKDWMQSFRTRNAVIQVWSSIINTFKGAPLDKTFLDYRRLARIFYLVLARGAIEKSLFVLSIFVECPRGMYFLKPNFEDGLKCFGDIFAGLILNDRGYCGRFAAEAYAAQCRPDIIGLVLWDIVARLKLRGGNKTMISNFVVLVRNLVNKYVYYFGNYDGISKALNDFCNIIRPYHNSTKCLHVDYLSTVLKTVKRDPDCIFDTLNALIAKTISLQTQCQYLLGMYAKTIFLLYEKMPESQSKPFTFHVAGSQDYSLYHLSVFSLVLSHGSDCPATVQKALRNQLFKKYSQIPSIQDPDMLSFFASTLPYLYKCAKVCKQRLAVFKLALFFMVCGETDKEFCKFIATINKSKLTNLMCSVKQMLTYEVLCHHLKCEHVVYDFVVYTTVCITKLKNDDETSFYSIDTESDSLALPAVKLMLLKCFRRLLRK